MSKFLSASALAIFALTSLAGCSDSTGTPDDGDRLQVGLVVESAQRAAAVESVAAPAGANFAVFTVTIGNKTAAPFALAMASLSAEAAAPIALAMPMADVSTLLDDACRDEMVLLQNGQVTCRFVVAAPLATRVTSVRLTAADGRSVDAQVPALPTQP